MNTEYLFLIVFAIYMTLNVIDDLKTHTTRNVYHYPMAALILIVASVQGMVISTFLIGLYALVFFIIFSKIPIVKFGAGDTKMLVNVYMFLNLISPFDATTLFFVISMVYFIVSYVVEILLRIKRRNLKGEQVHAEAPSIFIAFALLVSLFMI